MNDRQEAETMQQNNDIQNAEEMQQNNGRRIFSILYF